MKILHVNISDLAGGASIAMSRLHLGLREVGVDSQLLVRNIVSNDPEQLAVTHPLYAGWQKSLDSLKFRVTNFLGRLQADPDSFFCSMNLFSNSLVRRIEHIRPDIVNLHWVGNNILPIKALSQIRFPLVWTLHDMWPFCGAEHYDFLDRNLQQYSKASRSKNAFGLDLNRWTYLRKKKHWNNVSLTTVSSSNWILDRVQQSELFASDQCDHKLVPLGLDPDTFKPMNRQECRQQLDLTTPAPILLFGADSMESPMKGMPWLVDALLRLRESGVEFQIACFGRGGIPESLKAKVDIRHFGTIQSPTKLSKLYNAADLMLVPSRLESFGQTASEAQACGRPVVSFDTSGLRDIVHHQETGFRAACYSSEAFFNGIKWCLESKPRLEKLGLKAAEAAQRSFSIEKMVLRYREIYDSLISVPKR